MNNMSIHRHKHDYSKHIVILKMRPQANTSLVNYDIIHTHGSTLYVFEEDNKNNKTDIFLEIRGEAAIDCIVRICFHHVFFIEE
jgi:hypothetical protein